MRHLLLLLSLVFSGLLAAAEVRLTNGEWPPYLGQQLPHQGVASRIVAEAFALEGVEVHWEFYPWVRALKLAERGQRAGTAVWRSSLERERAFYISEPVVESAYHFFHRKDRAFDWQQVDDLRGLRICATRSYYYGAAFQQAEAEGRLRVNRLTSDEQCLHQLLAGRIDVFPMDKVVGLAMLQEHFGATERDQLSIHPKPLHSDSLHLLLSREVLGNAELMVRFNRGLARLRASGKIAQYLQEIQQPLSPAP
ncbi:ABC transporter substrate-binding protein [Pseudomonas sp. 2FE]|uniref:substrate-binding periplasmic protein n=1 Tax=Pseudomonas sp. 2FE TaxID=2502190 RepID=UPI0010F685F9|nr:transporter substrate-binding domain-containing protein [Pseudomonas sp. 2FE]